MGLFSSNKPPQPPLPQLSISLDNARDRVFKPDDMISGFVTLTTVESIIPTAIEVSLFGKSQIWHRTSSSNGNNGTNYFHWRDNAPLFEVTENLIKAPTPAKYPGSYQFPFAIRFPTGTGNSRRGQYKYDEDPRWHIGPHDLPPSFHQGHKDLSPNYAKIEYAIRARLICPGVYVVQDKAAHDLMTVVPILFRPPNRHIQQLTMGIFPVQQFQKPFHLQTSLLACPSQSSVSFRQSMIDRFSSSTPQVDFTSMLELPALIASSTEFRFRAVFTVMSKANGVARIPSITFTILKLEMLDFTFIRAPRDRLASNTSTGNHRGNRSVNMPSPDALYSASNSEREDFIEQRTTLNAIPPSATLELVDIPSYEDKKEMTQAENCETWFTARVPGFTVPSFQSFAITRAYKVRVKMGVEVGGKKFEHDCESAVCTMESAL